MNYSELKSAIFIKHLAQLIQENTLHFTSQVPHLTTTITAEVILDSTLPT